MTKRLISRWAAIIFILIGAALYGIQTPIVKLSYADGWSDSQISIVQLIFGALILWIVVLFRPSAWMNPFRGPWVQLLLIGIFGFSLTTIFLNASLTELDASIAIVLLFQFTWITMAMEALLNRRWPSPKQILAIGIILAGTVIAVDLKWSEFADFGLMGYIYGLLAACAYSVFLTFSGRVGVTMDPIMKSATMLTGALPIAVPVILIMYPEQTFFNSHNDLWSLLWWGIALGATIAAATTFLNSGIGVTGGSLGAMLGSAELPATIIAAALLVGESIQTGQWIGMFFILLGIITAEWKRKKRGGG